MNASTFTAIDLAFILFLIVDLTLMAIAAYCAFMAHTNQFTIRRVGGLTFVRFGSLRIQFSRTSKTLAQIELEKDMRSAYRHAMRENAKYWIAKGHRYLRRKIDLIQTRREAEMEKFLAEGFEPDDGCGLIPELR